MASEMTVAQTDEMMAREGEILSPQQEISSDLSPALATGKEHPPLFFVEKGIHTGATVVIDKPLIIGSSFDCDLILTDDGISERHAQIEIRQQKYTFDVKITCLGEGLSINGERHLTTGQSAFMSPFDTLVMGEAHLNLLMPEQSVVQGMWKKAVLLPLVALTTKLMARLKGLDTMALLKDWRNLTLGAVAVGGLIFLGSAAGNMMGKTSEVVVSKEVSTLFVPPAVSQIERAKKDLREVLEAQELGDKVAVEDQNGTLYVSGALTPSESQRWADVQAWFDESYAQKVDMVPLVRLNVVINNRISFKAVYAGEDAFVVSWTGERYRTGALLPEGWRIREISSAGVFLENAGREMVVTP